MKKLTPMMEQYFQIKKQYQDALLLFRLGDFYELFFDDAEIASRELEITLTGRDCGFESRAPMCGVPHHSVDSYIDRLITKGYKVAICEQVEDASEAVGIVKRDVVRIITPGTLIDTQLLDEKKNNYLMSIYGQADGVGISYVDISTGELFTTEIIGEGILQGLQDEITKIQPKEVIYYIEDNVYWKEFFNEICKQFDLVTNDHDHWCFEYQYASNRLKEHFNVINLDGLGLASTHNGIISTGALINYLKTTQKRFLGHINKINVYHLSETMVLDYSTRFNLELTETIRGKNKKGSLLWVLDKTSTAMGGRMLRKSLETPLLKIEKINDRLEAVGTLKDNIGLRKELREHLRSVYDLERLAAKISYGSANPRDLVALKTSLEQIPLIKELIKDEKQLLASVHNRIDTLEDIKELINKGIVEDLPIALKDGGIIKTGYHPEVDKLQLASREGKEWIAKLEEEEKLKTGIKSLKMGFNKVFGYYIEVTKSYLKQVPEDYQRKQTLANCERFITPELKEIESKILGAEDKVVVLEYQLFIEIRDIISKEISRIQSTASAIAELDMLVSLGEVAAENNYTKPNINSSHIISIKDGRHPVVEKMLDNQMFIANDIYLDNEDHQVSIITGPNMAGKSTYMRQVALIVLMAQIGSFIPVSEASIGIVDRIFTRVGASDDLSQGQSTFMVEMSEMANILNCATKNSLLILDEIGRGTSTFDGLSIAWSVIEHISKKISAKTLFSTHYHELTELEGIIKGVKNYRISVKEEGEDIIFLRKVIDGSADRSYGIQVARLAGLPAEVICRAKDILLRLEEKDIARVDSLCISSGREEAVATIEEATPVQIDFNSLYQNNIIEELKEVNLLETTPIEALNILANLQKKVNQLLQGGS
ncbi:DNA mismatch repair protein MutS [Alkaliphilus peptidifermentans]|uniref:DNA mismatch repair protein MutS n=2 Tax=Alkaliphilus TaxID=114627 RepID=A0A1G5KKK2_9FIRM|nr:DNA mismatch repair protein MutS [Alkaliphilus peptidifermentans]SCZ01142.1 DNA mismatch repair protein MutS [Alkaliphilus peptidifermentans DSM 18978]